ncbi:hypothetical protein QTP88_004317 [Uroleucon formosanum]
MNALDIIKIEIDRQFLLSQREKGRIGCMLERTVDSEIICSTSSDSDSDAGENISNKSLNIGNTSEFLDLHTFQSRGKKNFITPKLAIALDRCKISNRDAVHILTATVEAFGIHVNDLILNRTSINRIRQRLRKDRTDQLRKEFNTSEVGPVVVHWDGKLLPDLTGKELVDRLPVIVSYKKFEKLLNVPKLISGTGQNQAEAVFHALEEWGLIDHVQALCCNTTASNTGRLKGACIILEQLLERDILYFPCRHHIYEIILRSAFEVNFVVTSGPDIQIFKRFQQFWPKVNINNYNTGLEDIIVSEKLNDITNVMLLFYMDQLRKPHNRDDYRELLELAVIFLGGTPTHGISFKYPGAMHHARWISKAIYSLKIFIFQDSIRSICIFLIRLYIKAWFCAPIASLAPFQDLQFLKTPETAALAFFDTNLTIETKIKMVDSIKVNNLTSEINKRIIVSPNEVTQIMKKEIYDFIYQHPSMWDENVDFQKGLEIVNTFRVINDTAERGVKLMEEYNKVLTKNEEQKQYVLQVVEDYRRKYPNSLKTMVLNPF